jgi:regulator of sirC expression with transglutaminase-like and TPR domain
VDDLEQFEAVVTAPEPALDVAMALAAAHRRDEVEAGSLIARLDEIAETCTSDNAEGLCAQLFGPAGLRGNLEDYHDPRNSLLDEVLDRRLGIPLTLSLIAIEVGQRNGVQLVGIGMPGHFLVRDATDTEAFFDPFRGGAPLDRTACRALFERLHGSAALFHGAYLEPTPGIAIISRMLANLHHAYLLRSDRAGLIRVLQLQSLLPGAGVAESRGLADLLAADGRFDEAADLHQQLAASDPDPDQDHASKAIRLRARLN